MKHFFKILKPQRLRIFFFILSLLISTVSELLLPFFMSSIVDDGIRLLNMQHIIVYSIIMAVLAIIAVIAMLISQRLLTYITSKFTTDIREEIFTKTLNMTLQDVNKAGTGALLTRTTSDISMLNDFLDMLIRASVTIPVFIIGGSVLAFTTDPLLAGIMLLTCPIIIVGTFLLSKKFEPLIENSTKHTDKQNTIVRERLSGIRVIRAFNQEHVEHQRMAKATNIMADNIIKANIFMGILTPIAMIIINSVIVLIMYIGANNIVSEGSNFQVGDLLAIIQYLMLIMSAIFNSAMAIMMMPRAKVASRRINEIFNSECIDCSKLDHPLDPAIKAENVCFSYNGSDKYALTDINIDIKHGDTVALIGGTGSGKSTFLMCLAGLHSYTSGNFTIGGESLSKLSPRTLSDNISIVFQKSDIFSGTIRENLDFSEQGLPDQTILEALDVAQFSQFVEENGLDYMLNQAGSNLSGGQKQRLAIARGLLKDVGIYIFDDSFSALDYLTEQKLRARLATRLSGKTVIISTQRVATAKNCNTIYLFDSGKIVASGSHETLMQSSSLYREIYSSQTGGKL